MSRKIATMNILPDLMTSIDMLHTVVTSKYSCRNWTLIKTLLRFQCFLQNVVHGRDTYYSCRRSKLVIEFVAAKTPLNKLESHKSLDLRKKLSTIIRCVVTKKKLWHATKACGSRLQFLWYASWQFEFLKRTDGKAGHFTDLLRFESIIDYRT